MMSIKTLEDYDRKNAAEIAEDLQMFRQAELDQCHDKDFALKGLGWLGSLIELFNGIVLLVRIIFKIS